MGIFTKVAIRNVVRHSGRNILIGASIALAVGLFFFIISISAGVEHQMISNLVQIETGAVSFSLTEETLKGESQINRHRLDDFYMRIKNISEVSEVRERLRSRALINADNKSTDINVRGVDWAKESPLFSSLRFEYRATKDTLQSGILISQNVADKLGLRVNDYCSIMVQTVHGSLNLNDYPISGIYKNISGWANTMVFMNIDEVHALMNTNFPTDILIDCENLDTSPMVLEEVGELLQQEFQDTMDIESYQDKSSVASTIANANKYGFLSIVFFLQIISFFGIGFVVYNNVMERNKEIGTLLAMGFKPKNIRFSFMVETLVIATVSSFIGLFIFGAFTALISRNGIFLGDTATLLFGSSVLKPLFHFSNVFIAFAIGLIYPLLSAVWSTRKIPKANPIQLIYDR